MGRRGSRKSGRGREVDRKAIALIAAQDGQVPQASQPDGLGLYWASTHVMSLPAGWAVSKIKCSLMSNPSVPGGDTYPGVPAAAPRAQAANAGL